VFLVVLVLLVVVFFFLGVFDRRIGERHRGGAEGEGRAGEGGQERWRAWKCA
jgi:uncharacterized membrane protein